jgi:hypothetical protein
MPITVYAVNRPELPPLRMPDRFRTDIAYFMTAPGEAGVPPVAEGEYWVRLADARCWLDEGVLSLVSPLDSQNKTEVEISEEQEDWLRWMVENEVQHIRLA